MLKNLLTLFTAIAISWIVVGTNNLPYLGLSIGSFVYSCWLYFSLPRLSWDRLLVYILGTLLSINLLIRVNPIITISNLILLVYTQAYAICRPYNILEIIFLPLKAFTYNLQNLSFALQDFGLIFKNFSLKNTNLGLQRIIQYINTKNILSTTLLILILLFTLPLLSSANPLFAEYLNNILEFLDLVLFFKLPGFLLNSYLVEKLLLSLVIYLNLGSSLNHIHKFKPKSYKNLKDENIFNLNIPKIGLGIVILLFFTSQINLYYLSSQELESLNYSIGILNREIFLQLGLVASVIFTLVYFDIGRKRLSFYTSIFLILENFGLIFIAANSNYNYTKTFGLTFARFYGFVFLVLILGSVSITSFFIKTGPKKGLARYLLIWIFLVGTITSYINFDELTYNDLIQKQEIDYQYLSQLSLDNQNNLELYNQLKEEKDMNLNLQANFDKVQKRLIENQDKYDNFNPWEFNFSDYSTYQRTEKLGLGSTE